MAECRLRFETIGMLNLRDKRNKDFELFRSDPKHINRQFEMEFFI